jgi:hypothetical protein
VPARGLPRGATLLGCRHLRNIRGMPGMMVALFAAMALALLAGLFGRTRLSVTCLVLSLGLAVWLFLWEIYSPDTGFRMPWIQVEWMLPAGPPGRV